MHQYAPAPFDNQQRLGRQDSIYECDEWNRQVREKVCEGRKNVKRPKVQKSIISNQAGISLFIAQRKTNRKKLFALVDNPKKQLARNHACKDRQTENLARNNSRPSNKVVNFSSSSPSPSSLTPTLKPIRLCSGNRELSKSQ